MKKLVLILLFFVAVCSHAADTLHVITHNRETIVTDPAHGFNEYKRWGVFPSAATPVRKIMLKVRLACPDSMRCADWDYKDHITIRRKGGAHGANQDYEIGRMLTPYGGAFPKDWKFNWEVDVTDFSMLLRDSVEIGYNHTGYEPNKDRGWAVTLDFEIIKGTPAWEPVSIQKIYDNSYRYGDSSKPIENELTPVTFKSAKGADFARLRIVQTGHGMDRPDGCGEFCNKYRKVFYDGKLIDTRSVWKECGDNPLYPQAGTWIYDRANWCPGNLMQPDVYNLPLARGREHTVDVTMQPYISPKPSADEVISAYLIQYRKAAQKVDVALMDIISPTIKDAFRRYNPSVLQPAILVKNLGASTVKSLLVQYGTKGSNKNIYQWKGQLAPFETDTIMLPGTITTDKANDQFEAELLQPNGKKDGYSADNKMTSWFEAVPRHDSTIMVYLKTNNEPLQTAYTLTDASGKMVQQRSFGSLKANTVYRDTWKLAAGAYRFTLLDSGDNGLEFWANARGGSGRAQLMNKQGQLIKDFDSDFGRFIQYDFMVGQPVTPIAAIHSFGLYPTRTNDKTTLDYHGNFPAEVKVQITTDPGDTVVEEHTYLNLTEGVFTYDLGRFPKGRFYLKVLIDGEEKFKKRVRLKE
ncbi:MAG: peptide-N-glycosidase F-related protein [Chitinophagaceae bacterium]